MKRVFLFCFTLSAFLFSQKVLAQKSINNKEAQIKVSDSKKSPQVVVVDSSTIVNPKHTTGKNKQTASAIVDIEPAITPSKNVITINSKK